MTLFTNQLLTFFRIFTHSDVVGSIFLRAKVITVYNITYTGDGTGQRAVSLFATLAKHLSNHNALSTSHECIEFNTGFMGLIETVLAIFWNLVDVKTLAHSVPGFVRIAETFAALFADIPEKVSYHTSKARAYLEKLSRPIGIDQTIAEANGIRKPVGTLASFQLVREMPGELSEQGPRHDNDHAHIRKISILPTLQEIQSYRNEYLPVVNPQDWHFGDLLGLVDRHFRLLREDTVGQVRDAAKTEHERLQSLSLLIENSEHKRQSARTHVYSNADVISADFDEYHGGQVTMRFAQIHAK
jgi:hypothetical protein